MLFETVVSRRSANVQLKGIVSWAMYSRESKRELCKHDLDQTSTIYQLTAVPKDPGIVRKGPD